jgi:hypothetical protein
MQNNESTQASMFLMVQSWQQSGLSQQAYCREQNIKYHIFHYWFRKFKEQTVPTVRPGFVQLPPAVNHASFAEFTFPGGSRVTFHQAVSTEYLKALAS